MAIELQGFSNRFQKFDSFIIIHRSSTLCPCTNRVFFRKILYLLSTINIPLSLFKSYLLVLVFLVLVFSTTLIPYSEKVTSEALLLYTYESLVIYGLEFKTHISKVLHEVLC